MAETTLVKKLEELISDAKKADDFVAKEKALREELDEARRLLHSSNVKAQELEEALKWERVAFNDRKQQLQTERESTLRAAKATEEAEEKLDAANKEKHKLLMRVRELEADDRNVGKLQARLRKAKEDLEEARRTLSSFQGEMRPALLPEISADDEPAPATPRSAEATPPAEEKSVMSPVPLGKCSKNPKCMIQNEHDGDCVPWTGTKTGRIKASDPHLSNVPKAAPEVKTT